MRGKKTYATMFLVAVVGLLKAFGIAPDLLTDQTFAGIEAMLLGLGGMAMRSGIKNEANPRGVKGAG